jgi:hypothetical protein
VCTSIEDTSGDAVEGDDWTQRHMPMEITNNGNYYPSLNGSCKTSIVCRLTKHVLTSSWNDLGDDDEGVIFEDDDDENEGYLFAAQCTIFNFYYPSKAYVNTHVLLIVFKKYQMTIPMRISRSMVLKMNLLPLIFLTRTTRCTTTSLKKHTCSSLFPTAVIAPRRSLSMSHLGFAVMVGRLS